ncbi:glycosyltransferase family 4 protein [Arthrobacter sp. IA7]|uniref:glycosyltransferase family 4 protein n=1 Tax=Arthrobacter ipis TaxID=2716202 RepID=UPI0016868F91|nr:glycosyltransferase family 4 protein [Arthrobacter ipis]MBD1541857.1 glycosyltransferase family 4 protein [Arthrobacter ipis]
MTAMQEEAVRNPKWSHLLQGHDFSPEQLEALDREIELADHILVPSSFAVRTFLESGVPPEKLVMFPLGCASPDEFSVSDIESAVREKRALRVIYAGQVTQRKGIGYLLEAIAGLEGVQLQVVGTAGVQARTALSAYDNVEYIESQPRRNLYQLLQKADVLALPSLAEGFGLVALEAMANGTPCILSRNTFAADVVDDGRNGFILDDVSIEAIQSLITKIGGDPESLERIGAAAAQTAREYSWDRFGAGVARWVLSVVAERRDRQ